MPKYFEKETLEKLEKKLKELKGKGRREIAKRLEKAVSFGDLSENAAYQQAKEDKDMLEREIVELEKKIEEAIIVKKPVSKDAVYIGAMVEIESDKGKNNFKIVDPEEADPINKKISYDSPLGRLLLNKEKGDIVELKTPRGKTRYKIIKIF
jgi:transcription elongation factor GreA